MAGRSIGVIFGGPSAEHEVSLRSADGVIPGLLEAGFSVLPVRVLKDGLWVFGARLECKTATRYRGAVASTEGLPISAGRAGVKLMQEVEVAFPVIHGTFGEDGNLQGFLATLQLPFVGSGLLSSALCMNKAMAKIVIASRTEIHFMPSETIARNEWIRDRSGEIRRLQRISLPAVVKPVDGGSSVGVGLVHSLEEMEPALERSWRSSPAECALIEQFASGPEVTCVVVQWDTTPRPLPPILIRPKTGPLFDYQAKYTAGEAEELCPAPLPPEVIGRVQTDACAAFEALHCSGFARFDFVLEGHRPCFLEANTLPGLTRESLLPKSVKAMGWTMTEFLRRLIGSVGQGSLAAARALRVPLA